ncbi:hypothetical protein C8Q80DRAFT_1272977 [Daedaleopsis nitida]|nr:hypothetical protein C8Q80DRAFT_1272977 [Daedaleopsis nitida]
MARKSRTGGQAWRSRYINNSNDPTADYSFHFLDRLHVLVVRQDGIHVRRLDPDRMELAASSLGWSTPSYIVLHLRFPQLHSYLVASRLSAGGWQLHPDDRSYFCPNTSARALLMVTFRLSREVTHLVVLVPLSTIHDRLSTGTLIGQPDPMKLPGAAVLEGRVRVWNEWGVSGARTVPAFTKWDYRTHDATRFDLRVIAFHKSPRKGYGRQGGLCGGRERTDKADLIVTSDSVTFDMSEGSTPRATL